MFSKVIRLNLQLSKDSREALLWSGALANGRTWSAGPVRRLTANACNPAPMEVIG